MSYKVYFFKPLRNVMFLLFKMFKNIKKDKKCPNSVFQTKATLVSQTNKSSKMNKK